MTESWRGLLRNGDLLAPYYAEVPDICRVTIRSAYLDRRGPTLVLRLDLPGFADMPSGEWIENGCDRIQCHVKFLALGDVHIRDLRFPADARVSIARREENRIGVFVASEVGEMTFTSSDSLTVGHVSAFRSSDGSEGRHFFASKLDRRRFGDFLPAAHEKGFYG
ncbi:immunity 50 family protein [Streptomyces sp. S07_1.15]|uniref:immunity 50 family protein n=1 Tax=Streptomyces sp. S07_1.15 TaxID=2873925 RepID=UPI001D15C400|nr:immunity 50 family protein [Streptomyces sp. S07_1.15]MCC3653810.1 immunity 50 family protein [Streptomyces sp. S07_1.15]